MCVILQKQERNKSYGPCVKHETDRVSKNIIQWKWKTIENKI